MSGLSDCPFCGGTDSVDNACMESKIHVQGFRSAINTQAWRVECRCGASGRGFDGRDGISRAVEWWNRRALTTPKQEALE